MDKLGKNFYLVPDADMIPASSTSPRLNAPWQSRFFNYFNMSGDAALASILKQAEYVTLLEDRVRRLIAAGAEIEMRDRSGNTALIIAARQGLRLIVIMLLEEGANVHSRGYDGSGVLAQAEMAIAKAQSEGNDELYAKIMSCFPPLLRANAKHNPSGRDEFMLPAAKLPNMSGLDWLSIRI
jgi:ankyrin repeat protein